ncbi:MAG: hypothetical protein KC897_11400 [Candidatus Omnitrophica bacterium]|nr:hypothetical protein [Candidatus Omnitrophota bacterium]MCB9721897.1 hypothetical protein [Candidatus Omnitrophota bacterium]
MNDDFNAGLGGAPMGPNSDPRAYNHGRTTRENMEMQAEANKTAQTKYSLVPDQKVEVSGAAVGFLIFAPLFYIFYPVGGAINFAGILGASGLVGWLHGIKAFQWLAGGAAAIILIVPGYMVEKFFSRFAPYRFLRHILRVGLMGWLMFLAIHSGARKTGGIYTPTYEIPYTAIFWGVVTAFFAHHITRTLDALLSLRPPSKKEILKYGPAQAAPAGSFTAGPAESAAPARESKPISNLWIFWGVLYGLVLIMFSKHINPVYGILAFVAFAWYKVKMAGRKSR